MIFIKNTHYFTANSSLKSEPITVSINIDNKPYSFKTDHGVFAYKEVDKASLILLANINEKPKSILDIGCGYGLLGIVLAKRYDKEVTMVDINDRAVLLAKENSLANNVATNVILADGINSIEQQFDLIVTNPPIHAGKSVIYRLFAEAYNKLTPSGSFYFVIHQKHGAPSAIKEIAKIYPIYRIIYKKSGLFVIKCQKKIDE